MRSLSILGLTVLSSMVFAAIVDTDKEEIRQRISPVGQIRIQEDTPSGAQPQTATPKPAEPAKSKGQQIFDQYCFVCHRDGVAGAPKFRNASDWNPRLAKKIDGLAQSAEKGLNAMPPKGTCQECSEADLKAAIEYMVPQ